MLNGFLTLLSIRLERLIISSPTRGGLFVPFGYPINAFAPIVSSSDEPVQT